MYFEDDPHSQSLDWCKTGPFQSITWLTLTKLNVTTIENNTEDQMPFFRMTTHASS